MKKIIFSKKFLLVIALIMALTVSIPGTLGYIITKTETIANTFVPFKSLLGDVVISKTVEHPLGENYEIPENIAFDFRVELGAFYADTVVSTSKGDIRADKEGSLTVSVRPGESFGIKGIDAGTLIRVTELETDLKGFTVKGDSVMEVNVPDTGFEELAFVNAYDPEAAPFNAEWILNKKIAGRIWLPTDTFDFTLMKYDANGSKWVALGDLTLAYPHESADFNALIEKETFSEIGTYRFRIVEKEGNIEKITYDTAPRDITVTVTDKDMDGALEIDSITTGRGSFVNYDDANDLFMIESTFTNIYEGPQLNVTDHFAYIIGYPEDYRNGAPTDNEDLWPVKPAGNITRAEAATIFFRLLTDESRNQYWTKTNSYTDVNSADWFNNAVSTLSNAGILKGYEDGTFRPNETITRAEFTTIASRFFLAEYDGATDYFTDINGHWAQDAINKAAANNIISGYPDGTFKPDNPITRAEAVTVVNRTIGRKPHKDYLHADMKTWPDNADTGIWYYAHMQEATNSHDFDMIGTDVDSQYEKWTQILPIRDWAQLEREWSEANDGKNGEGDVIQ